MKTTQNLEMKIPEGADPIDIADITGNFEKLDTEIAKKANASGGDISAMAVKTLDTIATEFPVPSAGESSKTFLGKVRKFVQDFNNFKTGILTLGRLVNNGQATEPGFALDARYGRTLYELYAQLNADLGNLNSNLSDKASKSNNNILSAKNTYVFPVGLESSSFNSGLSVKVTAEHSSWARPGIGLVREGVEGVYLYLENKKLYYIDHDGITHEITST